MANRKPQTSNLKISFIAPFGLQPKATVPARALPLAAALVARGYRVRLIVPPYDDPTAPARGRQRVLQGVEVVELARPPTRPDGGAGARRAGLPARRDPRLQAEGLQRAGRGGVERPAAALGAGPRRLGRP